MQDIVRSAINASLACNWEEAIDLNLQVLANNPDDIGALNRLARAYTELDQKTSAKEIYQRVLTIDKFNSIALKSLKMLPNKNSVVDKVNIEEDFIEELGITKTVKLTKLASKNILLTLYCKEPLTLKPRARLVSIERSDGARIGSLPDDLSLRIGKLIKASYAYKACIKSATDNTVTIFMREVKRPSRITASPSFAPNLKLKDLRKRRKHK